MQKKLLASVIIVNFNNEKYILECLKSIFNQRYKKIEIIIVDEHSKEE